MGEDIYIQAILALIAVLAAIGVIAIIFKRVVNGDMLFLKHRPIKRKRMQVLETQMLDAKRRMVIVRCDQEEYFLLVGGQNDLLIKSQIIKQDSTMYEGEN